LFTEAINLHYTLHTTHYTLQTSNAAELESQLSTTSTTSLRATLLEHESRIRALTSKIQLSTTDLTVVVEKLAHLKQQKALRAEVLVRLEGEVAAVSGEVRALEKQLAKVRNDCGCVVMYVCIIRLSGIFVARDYIGLRFLNIC